MERICTNIRGNYRMIGIGRRIWRLRKVGFGQIGEDKGFKDFNDSCEVTCLRKRLNLYFWSLWFFFMLPPHLGKSFLGKPLPIKPTPIYCLSAYHIQDGSRRKLGWQGLKLACWNSVTGASEWALYDDPIRKAKIAGEGNRRLLLAVRTALLQNVKLSLLRLLSVGVCRNM